jgi:hypothetical protein
MRPSEMNATRIAIAIPIAIVALMILGPAVIVTIQQTADATSEAEYSSTRLSQRLDYAQFTPLTNSPGNQVKLQVNYSALDPAETNTPMNAVMEIYAANQSLIRTTSFPQPMLLNESGVIQLATTLEDETLNNVTARTMLTDGEKTSPISNMLETRLLLGQHIAGASGNLTDGN